MGFARLAGPIGLARAAAAVDELLSAQDRPPAEGRTAIVGEDPLRVLVVGAGTAVGYGVRTRARALDGQLAQALAARTGRGVVVETRIRRDLRLGDTVDLLGATGAHTFDAVVWSPTIREVVRFQRPGAWVRELRRILAHLRSTGRPGTGVVLLGFPEVGTVNRLGELALERQRRINGRIAAAAASQPNVRYVQPPSLGAFGSERLWNAEYYERCAQAVLPMLLEVAGASTAPLRRS